MAPAPHPHPRPHLHPHLCPGPPPPPRAFGTPGAEDYPESAFYFNAGKGAHGARVLCVSSTSVNATDRRCAVCVWLRPCGPPSRPALTCAHVGTPRPVPGAHLRPHRVQPRRQHVTGQLLQAAPPGPVLFQQRVPVPVAQRGHHGPRHGPEVHIYDRGPHRDPLGGQRDYACVRVRVVNGPTCAPGPCECRCSATDPPHTCTGRNNATSAESRTPGVSIASHRTQFKHTHPCTRTCARAYTHTTTIPHRYSATGRRRSSRSS
jgi:hypothetical protein